MSGFEEDVKKATECLKTGGIVLYPTDTIWGLGCNPFDEKAVERLFAVKNRPKEKSLVILLAEARDIIQYVAAPHPDIIDIVSSFTTPTTVIYDGALGFPDNVAHADGSIAIRVTTDPFCKALIKRWGKPLVSTSANLSGEPSPANFSMVSHAIRNNVDYIVEHRQDDTEPAQPSRIVKINDDGTLDIIRG